MSTATANGDSAILAALETIGALCSAGPERAKLIEQTQPAPTLAAYQDSCAEFISQKLGVPMTITVEDKQRAAIIEACHWLRAGAPSRALAVLEAIL